MVNYYDKNKERIRALEKAVAAGKMDPMKAAARIAELAARPDYWVRGYDGPKEIRKHVTPPHSEAAAKRLAAKVDAELAGGTFTPEALLRATFREMLAGYMKKREGDKSARTYAKAGEAMIGGLRLIDAHQRIQILVDHIRLDLPKRWTAEKTRWNYLLVLQAAVQLYLDSHQQLNLKNPVRTAKKLAEARMGTQKRTQYPAPEEYRLHVQMAKKRPFPAWFWVLVTAYGETGFRGEMIVQGFRWERLHLEHRPGRELPWIEIQVSKQKGEARGQFQQFPISRELRDALLSLPGPKEYGPVFPIKNIPGKHWRRLFALCGTPHLIPHDYRRLWKVRYLDHNPKLTAKGMGHATLSMDQDYTILERKEMEALYSASYGEEA